MDHLLEPNNVDKNGFLSLSARTAVTKERKSTMKPKLSINIVSDKLRALDRERIGAVLREK